MSDTTAAFINYAKHPVWSRIFLIRKLPSAFFSGVRVREMDESRTLVTVPYRWFSRNPFRSTYFACLSMAAEMSSGLLAMAHCHGREPSVSMLVTSVDSIYHKRATGLTFFTCKQGQEIAEAVQQAMSSGQAATIRVLSTGMNKQGDKIAEVFVTWSFKTRKPRQ